MKKLPGALFVVDPRKEHNAIAEARKLHIPIVAIVDTNCESSVQGMESFSPDTYYFKDILEPIIDGDTLVLISEGHATLSEDGTLTISLIEDKISGIKKS